MFKKVLLTIALIFSLGLVSNVSADTASDLQAQINAILAQIKQLQTQISTAQGTTQSSVSTQSSANTSNAVTSSASSAQGSFCYNWKKPLKIGDRGADVDALVNALVNSGIITNLNNEKILGEDYNEEVASAVSEFQEKYASEILTPNNLRRGTGFVGASTRAKLNALYKCGGIVARMPLLTIEPNNIKVGQITLITVKVTNAPANADVVLYSNHPQSGTASPAKSLGKTNSLGEFSISENEEYTSNETGIYNYWAVVGGLKSNNATINVHSGNDIPFNYDFTATPNSGVAPLSVNFSAYINNNIGYSIHFGDNSGSADMLQKCTASIPSSCSNRVEAYHTYTNPGTYVATLYNKATYCPAGADCLTYSPVLAKVTIKVEGSTSNNRPPVINGVTAPTSLQVGQVGTWTVSASDPENGSLSYAVTWGDELRTYNSSGLTTNSQELVFNQNTTFTHAYSQAGTYTVNFSVKDNLGQFAKTSVTVVVSSNPITSVSLKVLNPNGGEVWQKGTKQTIKWQPAIVVCPPGMYCMTVSPRPANYDIYLEGINSCSGNICTQGFIDEKIASSVPGSFYEWVVSSSTTLGSYRIKVCEAGTSTCDYSDGYLKIEGGLITNPVIYPAKITIFSPTRAKVGEQVMVYGMDFNTEKPNNIYFKNVRTGETVAISSATRSSVQTSFTVTNDLSVGEYAVYMNNNKGTANSNSVAFWVDGAISAQPSISAFPSSGTLTGASPTLWVDFVVSGYSPVGGEIVDFGDGVRSALGYTTSLNSRHDYHSKGIFPVKLLSANSTVLATTQVTVNPPDVSNSAPRIITESPLPSSINIGQTVNFSWTATDANNDDLTWNIDWGNGVSSLVACMQGSSGLGTQKSASYTWNTVGTYTVKVTVSDCKGGTDSRIFTVSPKEIVVVPTYPAKITLLSPNKGKAGDVITIYGMDFNTDKPNSIYLKYVKTGDTLSINSVAQSSVQTSFTVPHGLAVGEYALSITKNNGTPNSNSVAFTIESGSVVSVTEQSSIDQTATALQSMKEMLERMKAGLVR